MTLCNLLNGSDTFCSACIAIYFSSKSLNFDYNVVQNEHENGFYHGGETRSVMWESYLVILSAQYETPHTCRKWGSRITKVQPSYINAEAAPSFRYIEINLHTLCADCIKLQTLIGLLSLWTPAMNSLGRHTLVPSVLWNRGRQCPGAIRALFWQHSVECHESCCLLTVWFFFHS